MKDLFDVLRQAMPLWLTLITLGFGYLVYLFTKISKQTNDLAEKQAQYLKERIEIVEMTTAIFQKTVQNQKEENKDLTATNEKLKELIEKERKEKEVELSGLQTQLDGLLKNEGVTLQTLASGQRLTESSNEVRKLIEDLTSKMLDQIRSIVPTATQNDKVIADSQLTLAKAQMARGAFDDAASSFEQYTSGNIGSWEVYFSKAVNLANLREGPASNQASVKAYNDTINALPADIDPNTKARTFGYRGAILKRLNRLDEAEADLNIAKKYANAPYELDDINYNLACVYALQGDKDRMLSSMHKIKDKKVFRAIKYHITDYFVKFGKDDDFRSLLASKLSN